MTDSGRKAVPQQVHTNGDTPNPWWSNAVVYQIYIPGLSRILMVMA